MEKVNKYTKGKIYKIVDIAYNKTYYGSTVQTLAMRIGSHRRNYNWYKKGNKRSNVSCFDIFDEYGIENCKIELVELFPCGSREELEAREGYYIRNNDCVNKQIMGRTASERGKTYRENHKEQISDYLKDYAKENKDELKEYIKEYYKEHSEEIKNRNRERYEKNKSEINEKRRAKYQAKNTQKHT